MRRFISCGLIKGAQICGKIIITNSGLKTTQIHGPNLLIILYFTLWWIDKSFRQGLWCAQRVHSAERHGKIDNRKS